MKSKLQTHIVDVLKKQLINGVFDSIDDEVLPESVEIGSADYQANDIISNFHVAFVGYNSRKLNSLADEYVPDYISNDVETFWNYLRDYEKGTVYAMSSTQMYSLAVLNILKDIFKDVQIGDHVTSKSLLKILIKYK